MFNLENSFVKKEESIQDIAKSLEGENTDSGSLLEKVSDIKKHVHDSGPRAKDAMVRLAEGDEGDRPWLEALASDLLGYRKAFEREILSVNPNVRAVKDEVFERHEAIKEALKKADLKKVEASRKAPPIQYQ